MISLGAELVDPEERFLIRRFAWEAGRRYDRRAVEETRRNLVETGLFAAIRITHDDAVDDNDLLGMTVTVTERPARTVGAGTR